MSNDLAKVSKRIAKQMAELSQGDLGLLKENNPKLLEVFMGLGIALGYCYEAGTGQSMTRMKPHEMLRWAIDLPLEKGEKRIILQ